MQVVASHLTPEPRVVVALDGVQYLIGRHSAAQTQQAFERVTRRWHEQQQNHDAEQDE